MATAVGRYWVVRELGQSRRARVYLADDPISDQRVVVKVCAPGTDMTQLRDRLAGGASAPLEHPNLVRVLEVGDSHGGPFIAMEYLAGQTLASVLSDARPVEIDRALALAEAVASGLAFIRLHSLAFGGLDAGGVIVEARGVPRILGAGLGYAAGSDADREVATNRFAEAPGGPIGPRADVFALGALVYELLAGRPVWAGHIQGARGSVTPIEQALPSVDFRVAKIVNRCFAATGRYVDAEAVRGAIAEVRRRMAEPVRQPGAPVGESSEVPTLVLPLPAELPTARQPAIGDATEILSNRLRSSPHGFGGKGAVTDKRAESTVLIGAAQAERLAHAAAAQAEPLARQAEEAVAKARRLFAAGDRGVALGVLRRFRPGHPLVAAALAELEQEMTAIEDAQREAVVPQPADAAGSAAPAARSSATDPPFSEPQESVAPKASPSPPAGPTRGVALPSAIPAPTVTTDSARRRQPWLPIGRIGKTVAIGTAAVFCIALFTWFIKTELSHERVSDESAAGAPNGRSPQQAGPNQVPGVADRTRTVDTPKTSGDRGISGSERDTRRQEAASPPGSSFGEAAATPVTRTPSPIPQTQFTPVPPPSDLVPSGNRSEVAVVSPRPITPVVTSSASPPMPTPAAPAGPPVSTPSAERWTETFEFPQWPNVQVVSFSPNEMRYETRLPNGKVGDDLLIASCADILDVNSGSFGGTLRIEFKDGTRRDLYRPKKDQVTGLQAAWKKACGRT